MGITESKPTPAPQACPRFDQLTCGAYANPTFPEINYVSYNEYNPRTKRIETWAFDLNVLEEIIKGGVNLYTGTPLDPEWVKMVVPLYLRDNCGMPLQVEVMRPPKKIERKDLIDEEMEKSIREGERRAAIARGQLPKRYIEDIERIEQMEKMEDIEKIEKIEQIKDLEEIEIPTRRSVPISPLTGKKGRSLRRRSSRSNFTRPKPTKVAYGPLP